MGHPDDGMIRALLDEEATGEKDAARAHLATCPQCAETAAEQTADLQVLAEALTGEHRPASAGCRRPPWLPSPSVVGRRMEEPRPHPGPRGHGGHPRSWPISLARDRGVS